LAWIRSELALLRRDYPGAIRWMAGSHPVNTPQQRQRLLLLALYNHAAGDARATAVYADSVRQQVESDVRRLAGWRDVFGSLADLHGFLGIAHALLGHNEAAVKEGQIAVALNPVTRDAIEGPRSAAQLATIYTLIGDRDAALERLRFITTVPSTHWRPGPSLTTAAVLRLDPLWDPLRSDPRFETLIQDEARQEREAGALP
jgi:serine/threonine-protein kinase